MISLSIATMNRPGGRRQIEPTRKLPRFKSRKQRMNGFRLVLRNLSSLIHQPKKLTFKLKTALNSKSQFSSLLCRCSICKNKTKNSQDKWLGCSRILTHKMRATDNLSIQESNPSLQYLTKKRTMVIMMTSMQINDLMR